MAEQGGYGGGGTPRKHVTTGAKTAGVSSNKGTSKSSADGKSSEDAASLTTRMADLVLTEKETKGFIFAYPELP